MTEADSAKRTQIAKRLKEARKLAGLSQGHVAKILNLHRPSVSEMEAGNRRVSADELARLAEIYDVSVAWLLGETPETLDAHDPRLRARSTRTYQTQARRPGTPAQAAGRHAQRIHRERRRSLMNAMRTTKPSFSRRALATQAMQAGAGTRAKSNLDQAGSICIYGLCETLGIQVRFSVHGPRDGYAPRAP